MASGVLATKSVTPKCHSCDDSAHIWLTHDNASPFAQGALLSSRRNDICGCRLASALAGTGDTCSVTFGGVGGETLEMSVAGIAGVVALLEVLEAVDTLGNAVGAPVDCCSGKVNTTRTGAFNPSASKASRFATATKTYPCASSEPTAKGRAGFPSTAINAAPWPALLAMTPDSTNLSAGPGPGTASVGDVAPSRRAKITGLGASGIFSARGSSALMDMPASTNACTQYQPDTTTAAQTTAVAMRPPIAFGSLDIAHGSSHSLVAARKSRHGIAAWRLTHSRATLAISHGFTLIELMVVLVIIGVLAALIVPNVLDRADDARVMAARTDVNNLNQALKLYKLDNQRLPSTEQGLQALVVRPAASPVPANWKPYLDKLPNDPWGRPYQYLNPGVKGEVDVMSLGADGQPGGEGKNADVGSWQ